MVDKQVVIQKDREKLREQEKKQTEREHKGTVPPPPFRFLVSSWSLDCVEQKTKRITEISSASDQLGEAIKMMTFLPFFVFCDVTLSISLTSFVQKSAEHLHLCLERKWNANILLALRNY